LFSSDRLNYGCLPFPRRRSSDLRGLVGATWHWNVPKTTGSKDRAFYVSETDFDIKRALIPGTYEHGVITEDLDQIAEYLLLLKSDRKSTRLNSSHVKISYAVFCL